MTAPAHGTLDGWRRHQLDGAPPCGSCETARELWLELARRAETARLIRELVGVLAGMCADAGMLP